MAKTRFRTVFLDAGGVMITPNFPRLAEALARRGIIASVEALAGAEPYVKQELDHAATIRDDGRHPSRLRLLRPDPRAGGHPAE